MRRADKCRVLRHPESPSTLGTQQAQVELLPPDVALFVLAFSGAAALRFAIPPLNSSTDLCAHDFNPNADFYSPPPQPLCFRQTFGFFFKVTFFRCTGYLLLTIYLVLVKKKCQTNDNSFVLFQNKLELAPDGRRERLCDCQGGQQISILHTWGRRRGKSLIWDYQRGQPMGILHPWRGEDFLSDTMSGYQHAVL